MKGPGLEPRCALDPELCRELISAAEQACADADPAHDLQHVLRVRDNALTIAGIEGADLRVVEAAALLHELFNYPKAHPESHRSGEVCADRARALLTRLHCSELVDRVCECIRVHGFSTGLVPSTLEGCVLQDADRLDAIGAIGIARCFATCSSMRRPFYDPSDPFCRRRQPDDKRWGLDHFYRKLLRIADGFHTVTARQMGEQRTRFLRAYLEQLERELPAS